MDARVGCGRPGRGEGTAEPTANRLGSHLVLFKCRQFKLLFWSKWYYLLCRPSKPVSSCLHSAGLLWISLLSLCHLYSQSDFLSFARGVWKRGGGGMWRV